MPAATLPLPPFPYFFVGTFIEANPVWVVISAMILFPYFFVGTFIEALKLRPYQTEAVDFPTFS